MSMARDFLEQLAEAPVPPVPDSFNRALHERINNRLLVGQLVDLGLNGTGYTLEHFARAMAGFFTLTLTGKFEPGAKEGPGTAP
jgi:hypothetical protein